MKYSKPRILANTKNVKSLSITSQLSYWNSCIGQGTCWVYEKRWVNYKPISFFIINFSDFKMEIKQKFHTFIRDIDEYTYICNSLINRDLIVDFSGQIILSQVSREWKSLDVIVDNLLNVYKDVEKDILMSDVVWFFLESWMIWDYRNKGQ